MKNDQSSALRPAWLFAALFLAWLPSVSFAADAVIAKNQRETRGEQPPAAPAESSPQAAAVPEKTETKLFITINGKNIPYTVRTGFVPIYGENGEENGVIFSTSYIADGQGAERPVTFLFNGGPGSASIYLHVGAFGPKAFPAAGLGLDVPAPPYQLADNPDSPLDVTDLVFIDPIGTGFSHTPGTPAKPPAEGERQAERGGEPKGNEQFWGVKEDARAMAEFVRVWLVDNDRWGCPVFVAGESYGGLRAAGMLGELKEIGLAPSGVALISPALSYQEISDTLDNQTASVVMVPAYAAIAAFHKRLDPELQKLSCRELCDNAAAWAENSYLPALRKGNRLSKAEMEATARELARFTGLPAAEISARNLRVAPWEFSTLILRDAGLFTSLYDGRLTAPASGAYYNDEEEPISVIAGEPYSTAFMRFLTGELGLKTHRPYVFAEHDALMKWDFTLGEKGRAGFPETVGVLGEAMRRLPFLRVFLAMGRYDTVTPAESAEQSISRLDVPGDRLRQNLESHVYEGGHMMYSNPEARRQLGNDFRAFILKSPRR